MKLVISPSKVEKFRLCMEGEYNGKITEQEIIDYVTGKKVFSAKATFGTAYHALIELGVENFYDRLLDRFIVRTMDMNNPIIFYPEEIIEAEQFRLRYPHMSHECRLYGNINIKNDQVLIPMRLDGVNGTEIHDHKTNQSFKDDIDVEMYNRSLQWKIYLMAAETNTFQYNIFKVKQPEPEQFQERPPADVTLFDFKFYSYNGMVDDVRLWYRLFIEFCQDHKIIEHLYSKY